MIVQRKSAGNRGDIVKHAALVACVAALIRPQRRFNYAETHAGAPYVRLEEGGSWVQGIGALKEARYQGTEHYMRICNEVRAPHLDHYAAHAHLHCPVAPGTEYHCSTALVRSLCAFNSDGVRFYLFDTNSEVCAMLRAEGPAHVACENGYVGVERLVKNGVPLDFVLVDPFSVYEWGTAEFRSMIALLTTREISFLAWLPLRDARQMHEFYTPRFDIEAACCSLLTTPALAGTVTGVLKEIEAALKWTFIAEEHT